MGPHQVLYRALCRFGDKAVYPILPSFAKATWNHPAGPKTVFFWGPAFKWSLVIAGLADLARPADKLSTSQNSALMVTGAIWSRYSFVINPVNYLLASVNIFLCATGFIQLCRIIHYRYQPKAKTLGPRRMLLELHLPLIISASAGQMEKA